MNLRVIAALFSVALACGTATLALAADTREFSIPFAMDAGGQPLDGAAHRYTLTFAVDDLPPSRDWELVLFNLPEQDFAANAIHRHAIESRMLQSLVRDKNGDVTIYIQRDPPHGKRKANWLPAPDGPFLMQLRMFGPQPPVLDAAWETPPVVRAD